MENVFTIFSFEIIINLLRLITVVCIGDYKYFNMKCESTINYLYILNRF